jgi:polyhydroxybutyrate depolymerase
MVASLFLQKHIRAGLAAFLLASSLTLLPHAAIAQSDEARGTVRERLKQGLIEARMDRMDNMDWQAPAASPENRASIETAGDHTRSLEHQGLTRTYRVHVPHAYNAATPTPLLLAFHGGGGNMDQMAADSNYGLISKSEAAGFIVVFPNGYSRLGSGKFATWNAGKCCAAARDQNSDDVGFVRKIISDISRQLNIDRQQIFATGMSNGGMMAYRLACEMADTFKAIAAVAGTDNTSTCRPGAPVSILHIHAANDDRVLFNGGAGEKFRDAAQVTDFTSVPKTVSAWVTHDKCHATPERVLETAGAYCDRYSPCQGQAAVQLCVTERGGHSWPGGAKPRSDEPPSQAIAANDIMWAFFTAMALTPPPAKGRQ